MSIVSLLIMLLMRWLKRRSEIHSKHDYLTVVINVQPSPQDQIWVVNQLSWGWSCQSLAQMLYSCQSSASFDAIYAPIGAGQIRFQSVDLHEKRWWRLIVAKAGQHLILWLFWMVVDVDTYECMALAQSIIEFIHKVGAKTMFVTHHELTALSPLTHLMLQRSCGDTLYRRWLSFTRLSMHPADKSYASM